MSGSRLDGLELRVHRGRDEHVVIERLGLRRDRTSGDFFALVVHLVLVVLIVRFGRLATHVDLDLLVADREADLEVVDTRDRIDGVADDARQLAGRETEIHRDRDLRLGLALALGEPAQFLDRIVVFALLLGVTLRHCTAPNSFGVHHIHHM